MRLEGCNRLRVGALRGAEETADEASLPSEDNRIWPSSWTIAQDSVGAKTVFGDTFRQGNNDLYLEFPQ